MTFVSKYFSVNEEIKIPLNSYKLKIKRNEGKLKNILSFNDTTQSCPEKGAEQR